jgi:hypothetical protein
VAQRNYDIANENYAAAIDRFAFTNREFSTAITDGTVLEITNAAYDSNVAERNAGEAGVIKRSNALKMNIALVELNGWPTANFFFKDIPLDIIVKVVSNGNGKFSLRLAKGRYAIAAHSQRPLLNGTIEYYWFCWVNVDSGTNNIILNNSNLMEANASDAIMKVGLPRY